MKKVNVTKTQRVSKWNHSPSKTSFCLSVDFRKALMSPTFAHPTKHYFTLTEESKSRVECWWSERKLSSTLPPPTSLHIILTLAMVGRGGRRHHQCHFKLTTNPLNICFNTRISFLVIAPNLNGGSENISFLLRIII